MSIHGSLFERLNAAPLEQRGPREVSVQASVADHLAKMLGTRAGSVQTLPDYGLPDLNDMRLSLHDALNRARGEIERFIEAYEPRLSQVQVNPLPRGPDPLALTFRISGLLESDGGACPAYFTAHLEGSGQVTLRPERA